MGTAISQDGTAIAYEQSGTGPALVLVSGTLDRFANMQLAGLLASHFTVLRYDRRGHGESGDTQPWSLEREVEDVAAVVGVAGGAAGLFGSSGNGIFALEVAQRRPMEVRRRFPFAEPFTLPSPAPALAGGLVIVTGSGWFVGSRLQRQESLGA